MSSYYKSTVLLLLYHSFFFGKNKFLKEKTNKLLLLSAHPYQCTNNLSGNIHLGRFSVTFQGVWKARESQ